ncbi:2-C-methyl-D-erythritol 4-phosphate cytidylyltransferase [Reichenbachiella sp. MALMAid0571]|uniref:2-C-methyl-D-erythritol 4-phosphate cytidylyltransferase n=1 Tax=Reichenbachiella sp. MALMAid0571 TaxID=3143939 RepID=UPI0032DFAF22
MNKYAIIVAGGRGIRMGMDVPKQFLILAQKPVLMHTLEAFHEAIPDLQIILVLPSDQIKTWELLKEEYSFGIVHKIVGGGETRFDSVKNGLNLVSEDSLVAIHDGVRPLVCKEIIIQSFDEASVFGNAVTSVKLKESIRKISENGNRSVDRNAYRSIQTPQTFKSSLIKSAFDRAKHSDFTDDAGVLENSGVKIHLIDGDYTNIKITTKDDLLFAESLLK